MPELHDALKLLDGVEWDSVPHEGHDLQQYMTDSFRAGELICNSVPPQPDGTSFVDSRPHHDVPNSSSSHKDMHPSAARPYPPHKDYESSHKSWGKPMKFKAASNPLQISVYKMAGHDRHGAWFARRSIHEGLSFDKWKRAMIREFPHSMSVSGGPGAGAVRGIAADRRLEISEVAGTGKLEVYELSALFPGPVTPRDFLAMVLTTDDALTEKSAAELEGGKKHVPRHFMVVSRPIAHPDAPLRSGYVRGHYESVEMIREIPLSHGGDPSACDPELNPVEWIMVTRSDPGGGIPRFLVERGTPDTMIADVHKFFDWACSLDYIPGPDDDVEVQQANSEDEPKQEGQTDGVPTAASDSLAESTQRQEVDHVPAETATTAQSTQETGGMMNNLTKAIGAGLDSYAPAAVSKMVNSRVTPTIEQEFSDDSSDTSSVDSFLSAEELRRLSTAPEKPEGEPGDASADSLSIASGDLSTASRDPKDLNHHEKEILKLTKKRENLNQQLAKKRLVEESKFKQSQEKEEYEAQKQKAEMEKRLKKTEERHRKELEKLEAKKAKETRKAEEKRRKKDEQSKISLVTRERDEFRSQADIYRRENDLLREQVAELQAQNNVLAQRLGQIGGQDALRNVQERMGHGRSRSTRSFTSSSDSAPNSVDKKALGRVSTTS